MAMVKHCFHCRVYMNALYALGFFLNSAVAIKVTATGPQTIKKAQGEDVMLACTYIDDISDIGQLDIEWSKVSPDMTQKDELILSYSGGKEYKLGNPELMSRLKFVSDPSRGDASISISLLRVSDTATYECKVKKPPGIDSRKVTLLVLVPPSVPKCWVDNGEEIGSTISLRCKSSDGSIPLSYKWMRETGLSMPPTTVQNPQTGELLIHNHSQSFTGNYVCEVSNDVGKQQCKYSLKAYNKISKAGVIAGAVIGSLLLLLLLLLLIWVLICCYQKHRYEKEAANEIKEDAAAPDSHHGSRHSSFRSIMGYHTHQGITSTSRNVKLHRAESGRTSTSQNQVVAKGHYSSSDYKPPLRYDSRYGYPV